MKPDKWHSRPIPHAVAMRCNEQPEGDSAHKIPLVTQNTRIHGSSLVELTCICLLYGLCSCVAVSGRDLAAYLDGGLHYVTWIFVLAGRCYLECG